MPLDDSLKDKKPWETEKDRDEELEEEARKWKLRKRREAEANRIQNATDPKTPATQSPGAPQEQPKTATPNSSAATNTGAPPLAPLGKLAPPDGVAPAFEPAMRVGLPAQIGSTQQERIAAALDAAFANGSLQARGVNSLTKTANNRPIQASELSAYFTKEETNNRLFDVLNKGMDRGLAFSNEQIDKLRTLILQRVTDEREQRYQKEETRRDMGLPMTDVDDEEDVTLDDEDLLSDSEGDGDNVREDLMAQTDDPKGGLKIAMPMTGPQANFRGYTSKDDMNFFEHLNEYLELARIYSQQPDNGGIYVVTAPDERQMFVVPGDVEYVKERWGRDPSISDAQFLGNIIQILDLKDKYDARTTSYKGFGNIEINDDDGSLQLDCTGLPYLAAMQHLSGETFRPDQKNVELRLHNNTSGMYNYNTEKEKTKLWKEKKDEKGNTINNNGEAELELDENALATLQPGEALFTEILAVDKDGKPTSIRHMGVYVGEIVYEGVHYKHAVIDISGEKYDEDTPESKKETIDAKNKTDPTRRICIRELEDTDFVWAAKFDFVDYNTITKDRMNQLFDGDIQYPGFVPPNYA